MTSENTESETTLTLWERLERPARSPRQVLSGERIASAAVALADAEGLCAVTMRSLADRLDVAPMAAYRFVSGKQDLLMVMVDHIWGEVDLPTDEGWRETLREYAIRTRELMRRHRWMAELAPEAALALTPNRMRILETALAALDGLGLDLDTMMGAARTVGAYVQGAIGMEVAQCRVMEGEGWFCGDEKLHALGPQMKWLLSTGRYPVVERYQHGAELMGDPQARFMIGLEFTLDGIAARIDGSVSAD